MKSLHVLGICGSLRRQSTNLGLLRYAKEHAPSGMVIELASLQDVPFYNADLKEIPGPVQKLNESIGYRTLSCSSWVGGQIYLNSTRDDDYSRCFFSTSLCAST